MPFKPASSLSPVQISMLALGALTVVFIWALFVFNLSSARSDALAAQQAEHARSSRAATVDHLSGLFNRRQFLEVAPDTLAGQRRNRYCDLPQRWPKHRRPFALRRCCHVLRQEQRSRPASIL